jgi:psiF repeat-containing protein
MMRVLFTSTLVAAMLSLVAAASAQQTPNAQQERMKSCNNQASTQNLSGESRKSFMSECLAGKETSGTSAAPMSQQDKMKACNTQASSQQLAGDTRKQFMSSCLKGH